MYVVVFEVLERERSKNINGMATFFAAVLGFVAMLLVEIFGAFAFLIWMCILGQKNALIVISFLFLAGHSHDEEEGEEDPHVMIPKQMVKAASRILTGNVQPLP